MHASEMETNYSMVLCFTVLLFMNIISDAHDCSTTNERFRLHNTTSSSGIVQALSQQGSQQGWFPICVFGGIWHFSRASEVLCRQLGYEGLTESVDYTFPVEDPVVLLHWIDCRGDEEQVSDCEVDIDERVGMHPRSCRGVEVVCTACQFGSVRLSGGLIPEQGNVEMCIGGRWTGVSRRNWDYKDAFVVCRQLGLPATDADSYSKSVSFFGEHKFPSNVSFKCIGNESQLTDCLNSSVSHFPSDVAGVYCKGEIIAAASCTNGQIRLAGGQDQNEGRVEVCSGGLWGTVDDSNWDINDARVACRQLGYGSLNRVSIFSGSNTQRLFGSGNGPIPLAGLRCIGNETSLFGCPTYSYPYSATHSGDVGLKCQPIPPTASIGCPQGSVRLLGGDTQYEGRVEICIDGVWGSVCDYSWDIYDSAIVCHQLGFGRENVSAVPGSHYGEGEGPYHLSGVNCRGHENTLLECRNSTIRGSHNCIPGHDAGVNCQPPSPPCNHGDVRLYAGYTDQDGIAEVCINGTWGAFCDDYFGTSVATMFCRQLTGRNNVLSRPSTCCSLLPFTGNVMLTRVTCSGNESRVVDCRYGLVQQGSSEGCSFSEDTIVQCYVPSGCTNGDVQIVNGSTTFEGRVEICIDGIWRAVTSSSWDVNDAEVVCRQLGYPWEWALPVPFGTFGRGNAPFGVDNTRCSGNEARLIDCRRTTIYIFYALNYRTYQAAGVICQGSAGNQTQCDTGALRLVNGQQEMEGRVEICASGTWATVCDGVWRIQETHAVCRQLGYPTGGSYHLAGRLSMFGRNTAIPILGQMDCSDQASGISDCRIHHQTRYCHHGKSVGVVCRERVHYNISIEKSEVSYELGSQVALNCIIRPLPADNRTQITYEWSSSASQSGSISYSPQMSNATVTIPNNHPPEALYYCRVYRNGVLLGVGKTTIHVREFIHAISPTNIQALPQDTIVLQVNTTDIEVKDYLRELAWYHNGRRVVSSGRVILSRGNKTLTIMNSAETNNGIYEAKFEGLLVYPYNQLCEELTLSLLRQYPILMPILFHVNFEGSLPHTSMTNSGAGLDAFPNSFTAFDDVTMTAYFDASDLPLEEYSLEHATVWWFANGIRFSRTPLDIAQQKGLVNLYNLWFHNSGTYETLLIVDASSVYGGCDDYYNGFVTLSNHFGNRYVAVSRSTTDLPYYEMLSFEVEVDNPAITWEESATITCSASIKYPPLDSITLIKNGVHVATSSEGKIQVNSASLGVHPFGEYVCVVDASGIRFQKEITIEEQGFLQVEAAIDSSLLKCSTTEASVSMVTESVVSKIRADCFCNITSEAFINSSITCSTDKLIFSTTVKFSTDDGHETASTVIDRIFNQASYSSFPLVLNGTTALVTSAYRRDCAPTLPSSSDSSISTSEAVWLFIGGLFAGAILCAIVTLIIVLVLIKKMKSAKLQSEDRYARRGADSKIAKEKPLSQTGDGKPRSKAPVLPPPQAAYMEMNVAYNVHTKGKRFKSKPYENVHTHSEAYDESGEAIYEETF